MAKADEGFITKKVERVVVDEFQQRVVNLQLSQEEAKTLVAILRRVGGSQDYIRGHADDISSALVSVIGIWSFDGYSTTGGIYCGEITADDLNEGTCA